MKEALFNVYKFLVFVGIFALIGTFLYMFHAERASAFYISQSFDSSPVMTPVRDLSGFNASSSSQYFVDDTRAISPSNSMSQFSSGASNFLFTDTFSTSFGIYTSIVWTDGTGTQYHCIRDNSDTRFCITFNGTFQTDVIKSIGGGTSEVLYTFPDILTPAQWHNIAIEWDRYNYVGKLAITFTAGTMEYTEVVDFDHTQTQVFLNVQTFPHTSNSIDNFVVQTDDDYERPSETDIPTGVTQEFDTVFLNAELECTFDCILVTYDIDETELIESNPARNIQAVRFLYSPVSTDTILSDIHYIDPTTATSSEFDVSYLDDGTYSAQVQFYNNGTIFTGVVPFAQTHLNFEFTISSGVVTDMSPVEIYDSEFYNEITTYKPCSVIELWGCIENAGRFLFVPSIAQLKNFEDFKNEIPNRYPFSWFFGVAGVIEEINQAEVSFPTYTIPLPFIGNWEILSQATIDKFYPSDVRELFRDIVFWSLVVTFFAMAFFSVGSVFGSLGGHDTVSVNRRDLK